MDIALIISAGMTLLKPLLEKASEKAGETIGQRIAESTTEKSFWKKVKRIFIIEDEEGKINSIESKITANNSDIIEIENKLTNQLIKDPDFAIELEASLNISSTDSFVAEQLLISITNDREKLKDLYEERRNAGVEAIGGYENMIIRTRKRLEKDEVEFRKLFKS